MYLIYYPPNFQFTFISNLQTGAGKRGTVAAPGTDEPSLSSCAYVALMVHRRRDPTRRLSRIRCCSASCRDSWRRAAPNYVAPPRMQFRAATSRARSANVKPRRKSVYHEANKEAAISHFQPSAIKSSCCSTARGASNCTADVI